MNHTQTPQEVVMQFPFAESRQTRKKMTPIDKHRNNSTPPLSTSRSLAGHLYVAQADAVYRESLITETSSAPNPSPGPPRPPRRRGRLFQTLRWRWKLHFVEPDEAPADGEHQLRDGMTQAKWIPFPATPVVSLVFSPRTTASASNQPMLRRMLLNPTTRWTAVAAGQGS